MNVAIDFKSRSFDAEPKYALVFYKYPSGSGQTSWSVTYNEVLSDRSLNSGKLLNQQILDDVISNLSGNQQNKQILPEHVLMKDPSELLWWKPAQVRSMWFLTGKRKRRLTVPWPALLFHVVEQDLSVFALSQSIRPDENTPLFHAPIMNVYGDGRLCLGNIISPSCNIEDMGAWESAIYDTLFSHTNHKDTLQHEERPMNDNLAHYKFWSALHKKKGSVFPVDRLVPINQNVAGLLNA